MKTKTVKISETKMYQMRDSEGEDMGLLKTNLPLDKVEKEWENFYRNSADVGVDTFVEAMKKKYDVNKKSYTFERVFCEAVIYPN